MEPKDIIHFAEKAINANASANDNGDTETTSMHELYDAVNNLDEDVASKIIEQGFDVDTRDMSGDTLLHVMILQEAGFDVIKLIIELGFEINALNKRKWSALYLVRKYLRLNSENKKIHNYLVSKGAIAKPDMLGDKWCE